MLIALALRGLSRKGRPIRQPLQPRLSYACIDQRPLYCAVGRNPARPGRGAGPASSQLSGKQTSTTWPALPLTATADFCIRPQGLARGALDGKFTLKAVAFDKNREPRTLKINESLNTFICETTTSTCEDEHTYFRGDNRVDKTCTVFR